MLMLLEAVTFTGLNDAVAPAGNPPVTVSATVHVLLLPLNPTVIANVALTVGATVAGDCEPTVMVWRLTAIP